MEVLQIADKPTLDEVNGKVAAVKTAIGELNGKVATMDEISQNTSSAALWVRDNVRDMLTIKNLHNASASTTYQHNTANTDWVCIMELWGKGCIEEFIVSRTSPVIYGNYYGTCGFILEADNAHIIFDEPASGAMCNASAGILVPSNMLYNGYTLNSMVSGSVAPLNITTGNKNTPILPRINGVSFTGPAGMILLPRPIAFNTYVRVYARYTGDPSMYNGMTVKTNLEANLTYSLT